MEKILCDDRIEEIRLHYEKKVMERFVENYIKGLRDFKITEKGVDAETGRPTFVLQFVDSSTSYSIQNWNCSCNELEKTGVACPHLILAATTTRGKSYDELISRRWKKEPVQLEEAPPKYVLRRSSEMAKGRRAVGRK
jgi:hypothetical protein